MPTIRRLPEFIAWISGLRDARAVARITVRIDRLALGNAGQAEAVGEGVSELKVNYGPGYRVYYKTVRGEIVVLLCGGDKSSQSRDIKRAKALAETII